MEALLLDKIKLCSQVTQEAAAALSLNLNFHKLDKQNKMMDPNLKEAGSQTTSRMDNQAQPSSNSQAMDNRFKVRAISRLVKTNIISIWMLKSSHNQLKIIMEYQSKEEV